jgi:hypothetical protein
MYARERSVDELLAREFGTEAVPAKDGAYSALAVKHAALQKELSADSAK